MSSDRTDAEAATRPAGGGWDGNERRTQRDRRSRERRLDERRRAGIGEIIDDRRAPRGRRQGDRQPKAGKGADRRVIRKRRDSDPR